MFWQRLMFWRKRRQRDIFTFWDGERDRSIDPMPAWFAIENDPDCDPKRDFPAADRGDRGAWARNLALFRRMFGVKPFKEGGLTEYELQKVFGDFYAFVTGLKKKHEDYRTQWASSVGEPPEASTTPPDAESSSTQTESSSDGQSPSSLHSPPQPET